MKLLFFWNEDVIVGVIATGVEGHTKLFYSAPQALAFLTEESSKIDNERESLILLETMTIKKVKGFRPKFAAKLPGDIIALGVEVKPVMYFGFDETRSLVSRNRNVETLLTALEIPALNTDEFQSVKGQTDRP